MPCNGDPIECGWEAKVGLLEAENERLREALLEVLHLHRPSEGLTWKGKPRCEFCSTIAVVDWPCRTAALLAGTGGSVPSGEERYG